MKKSIDKTNADFYEHIYKEFIDFLAVSFFLHKDEEPPENPDLLKYIHTTSRDCEFIDYLILNIHRLVFVENFSDKIKTAIKHLFTKHKKHKRRNQWKIMKT